MTEVQSNPVADRPLFSIKTWSFSLFLIVLYLVNFHLWNYLDRVGIVATGALATVVGIFVFMRASKANYFVNRWDALFHGSVVFDIFMEGVFIPFHSGFGFYFCGTGFLIVVGGYRLWRLKQKSGEAMSAAASQA